MKLARFGLLAATATLAACSHLPEGRWLEKDPGAGTKPMTLTIREGRLAAYAGCNRMMGSVEMSGNKLVVGNLASTLMACPYPSILPILHRFFL